MKECVIVLTYKRDELLWGCLNLLRGQDSEIPIFVFHDRGIASKKCEEVCTEQKAWLIVHPNHSYYGNSFAAGEALRFAYNSGYELIHYIEDDAFIKPDFFKWTRETHEAWNDIFCTCGWVFNREAEVVEGTDFAPWIYIPQFSIKRKMLNLALPHLNPLYYGNMKKYLTAHFKDNPIKDIHSESVVHFEIDGLLQRIIMGNKLHVAWNNVAKIKHMGFGGYNQGWPAYEEFFEGCQDFTDRCIKVLDFFLDPYWRGRFFGREIVEREEGHELPKRFFKYRITVGEFETEFVSDLLAHQLPRIVNSVPLPSDAKIMLE